MIPTAIDIGNSFTKLSRGSTISLMPSLVSELLNPSEACEDLGERGAILTYLGGDRTDLIGKTWALGDAAHLSSPAAVRSVLSEGGNRGKVTFGLQLLIAGLNPSQGEQITIGHLVASLPDITLNGLGEDLKRAMIGRHRVLKDGVEFHLTILECTLKPESSGALVFGISNGLLAPKVSHAIVDIGSGTVISSAFSPTGKIIPSSRFVGELGVSHLVKAIAKDTRLKNAIGGEGKPHLIERAISSDFQYGATGFNLEQIYQDRLKLWKGAALKPALEKLEPLRDDIDTILLIGGGALIVRSLAGKANIILCSNPQSAHVRGLGIIAKKLDERMGVLTNV